MVHELGHIYLTFLSMGGTHTPDSIGSLSGGTSQDSKAEAGSHLECLIFGGVMMPMRNPAEGNEQVCQYMRLLAGVEAYELTLALVWRASHG